MDPPSSTLPRLPPTFKAFCLLLNPTGEIIGQADTASKLADQVTAFSTNRGYRLTPSVLLILRYGRPHLIKLY